MLILTAIFIFTYQGITIFTIVISHTNILTRFFSVSPKVRMDLGFNIILVENPPDPIFHAVTIEPDKPHKGLPKFIHYTSWSVHITNFIQESERLFNKLFTYKLCIFTCGSEPFITRIILISLPSSSHGVLYSVLVMREYVVLIARHQII